MPSVERLERPGGAGPLGILADNCCTPGQRAFPENPDEAISGYRDRRSARWNLGNFAHQMSTLVRVRCCGTRVTDLDRGVELKLAGQTAHFTGIQTCGSPWACPVCSAKIAAGRVTEIAAMVRQAELENMGVHLGTWTFSHHRGERLLELLEVQQRAWYRMSNRRPFKRLRERYGLEWARRVEMTWEWDRNGWHPHFHAALFTRAPLTEAERAEVDQVLSAEWLAALQSVGRSALQDIGFTLKEWDGGEHLAEYLTKQGVPSIQRRSPEALGIEVGGAPFKRGNPEKGLTPWDLLQLASEGDADAFALWGEYEAATKGRRTTNLSRGARALLARAQVVEQTDEELAAAEVGGDLVLTLDGRHGWPAIRQASYRGSALIEACERSVEEAAAYVASLVPAHRWWLPDEGKPEHLAEVGRTINRRFAGDKHRRESA